MSRNAQLTLSFALVVAFAASAAAALPPFGTVNLIPIDDTWATHDDGLVHGSETIIKVGIEPQGCLSVPDYDPCPDDGLVCCEVAGYNYCAADGECETTTPSWKSFRKFRGYLRFDISQIPTDVSIVKATLSLRPETIVNNQGGPFQLVAHRLKGIGFPSYCDWTEGSLDDTNGTTWSSLPQNLSIAGDGEYLFIVTKAVIDWMFGDPDKPQQGIQPNCGFMLDDADFGTVGDPIERWVEFKSRESGTPPQLIVQYANDVDGDGYYADVDCDETNPAIHPGQTEVCDEVDNDCDGQTDEEDCDGLDNDCDGYTDEGVGICGDGASCIAHQCEPSCIDDCSSTSKVTCMQAEDGNWERWGCGHADEDPCLDWYFSEACDPGWNCNYGYCSTNCLDDDGCDEAGIKGCQDVAVGVTATAVCGEYDGDECLDWGDLSECPPGTECDAGTCVGTPCENPCTAGDRECVALPGGGFRVRTCWYWGGGPCLSWGGEEPCGEGVGCQDGGCGGAVTCTSQCDTPDTRICAAVGEAYQVCEDTNGDGCLEWNVPVDCAAEETCEAGVCVGPPEPDPEPEAEPEPVVEAAEGPEEIAEPEPVVEEVIEPGPEPEPEAVEEIAEAEAQADEVGPVDEAIGKDAEIAEPMVEPADDLGTPDEGTPDVASDAAADLAPDPGSQPDAGPAEVDGAGAGDSTPDMATETGGGGDDEGCGSCTGGAAPGAGLSWLILLLGWGIARRRQRRTRA